MWILKILEQLPGVLVINIRNGKPFLLFIVLPCVPESQRGIHLLTWSSHMIFLLLKCEFPLVHTIKLRRYVQDNVFLTLLDIPLFTNIVPSTNFHVHRCELLFPERLLIGATVINIWWWCYNL